MLKMEAMKLQGEKEALLEREALAKKVADESERRRDAEEASKRQEEEEALKAEIEVDPRVRQSIWRRWDFYFLVKPCYYCIWKARKRLEEELISIEAENAKKWSLHEERERIEEENRMREAEASLSPS